MIDSSLFQSNFNRLQALNAHLASHLLHADKSHLTLCETKGDLNLLSKKKDRSFFLHSPEGARQESRQWRASLDLSHTAILYIYGIGLGYYFEEILPWLEAKQERRVVFLESDLAVLHFFLSTKQASTLLAHPRIDVQDISRLEQDRSSVYWLTWDHLFQPYSITALSSYVEEERDKLKLFTDLMAFESTQTQAFSQERLQYGIPFFQNFYSNLFQLPEAYAGTALFGKFKGIPAIICGAGPLLAKNLPILSTLENKALLFAPGSAMNILSSHGIWPHFGVAIDPNPETFHRIITNRAFETPFFYRNRVHPEALRSIHGPHLFIPGSGEYPFSQWLERKLKLKSTPVDEGCNVVNFATEIAYRLGCNPIIFVGMNLSLESDQYYAPGVEQHPLYTQQAQPHLGSPLQVQNQEGAFLTTYWPWIAEAQWSAYFASSHPDIAFINASEGGLGLFTIPNLSLQHTVERYLNRSFPLENRIHQALQKAKLSIQERHIYQILQDFYLNLQKCQSICDSLLQECWQQGSFSHSKLQYLQKQIGYKHLLQHFDQFYFQATHWKLRRCYLPYALQQSPDRVLYQELQRERLLFLKNALHVQLNLLKNLPIQENKQTVSPALKQSTETAPLFSNSQERRLFDQAGRLLSVQTFLNNKRHGRHLYYYPNGALKSDISYQNGLLHGDVYLFYPNGQIKRHLQFKENQRHGVEKSWYDNGQLFTQVEYREGHDQEAKCWLKNGILAKEIRRQNGSNSR
jgi:hypothetical protein